MSKALIPPSPPPSCHSPPPIAHLLTPNSVVLADRREWGEGVGVPQAYSWSKTWHVNWPGHDG